MENEQNLIETDLIIDSTISMHLKETAVWGKFLGVVGFIYSGLIALVAVFAGSMPSKLPGNYNNGSSNNGMLGGTVAFFYLLMAGVVFFMSMYLYRFARKTQVAIQATDQDNLAEAFKNLKIYFRLAGIITVIALILCVLGVIGIMVATAFSRGM